MIENTRAMNDIIGTINNVLKVTREEVKQYGHDMAFEMHCTRSNLWIMQYRMMAPKSKEEESAAVIFAAALQFVNVLFATGEIDHAE